MDIDPELIKQLVQVFKIELGEQIEFIVNALLVIETADNNAELVEVLNDAFRAAHNIKGAASGVGVADVSDISHHMETLFANLKQNTSKPSGDIIDLCLECLDRMREAMDSFLQKTPLTFNLQDLVTRLERAAVASEQEASTNTPAEGVTTEQQTRAAGSEPEPEPETKSDEPNEQLLSVPDKDKNESIRVSIDKMDGVAALTEELQVSKIENEDHLASIQQLRSQIDDLYRLWKTASPIIHRAERSLPDDLLRLLKTGTDSLSEIHKNAASVYKGMRSSTNRMAMLSVELQNDIHMLRLLPAITLLMPLQRSVRDIARELNKKIEFKTTGVDIEMDRAVIEGIRDPLMHLLRNAIDHGIETPEARRAKGKAEHGVLQIHVKSEGNEILIVIEDDGAGIDVDVIANIALSKKIITRSELESMDDDQIIDLIFRPGFSSREIITDVSGRGVGLDVVMVNVRKMKGKVSITTEPGRGCRFSLHLPLTLATDRGLLINTGGVNCAIPVTSIERVMELKSRDIINVEATEAVLINGRPVPLRKLDHVLEMESRELLDHDTFSVVVISKGWNAVAFVVDEIIGEREIVIKPLRPPLISVRNVNGGTQMGSGEIIIVLNPADLVESALKSGMGNTVNKRSANEETTVPSILVVDDSITTRTLEKNILENAGYKVEVSVDGKEAWTLLQTKAFDLVITDVEMPDMDGFTLTEHIKQSETLSDTPVIIVTSLAKDADRQRGIDVGADAYLVKSQFETRALLEVVTQIV